MSGTVRLAEVLAEKDARIAELEAADAEDNLCLRTAIERNAELEARIAELEAENVRLRGCGDPDCELCI